LTFYPRLARAIGLKESILLCQLIYWTPRSKRDGGWVYKSAEEFEMETGLSYKEQRRVREVLRNRGLIEERNAKDEHRLYFRVIPDAIDRAFEEHHLPNGHMPNGQVAPAQREDGTCPKGSSLIGTEITQETTHSPRAHATPQARPVNPDPGAELMAAVWFFEELAIPSDPGTRIVAAEAIRMLAKTAGGIQQAAEQILQAAKAARDKGETVNRFWFTDQRYMPADKAQGATTGGSSGANRSSITHERVSANKRALAEALARRGSGGVGSTAGADGGQVSSSGPQGFNGGLPV
jgi:hypothetical protein